MASITNEPEILTPQPASGVTTAGSKSQPAAAEIPVTINGARTIRGTDKREPFSESTNTVLIHGSGAVIRLASAVSSGQLLFLTNEKTKKEVVCQVVKSKHFAGMSGYVELEFTEAAAGFWGLRFPSGVPTATAPAVSQPVVATGQSVVKPPVESIPNSNVASPAAPDSSVSASPASVPEPTASKAVPTVPAPPQSIRELAAATDSKASEATPAVLASSEAAVTPSTPAPRIPTLSEFLTQGTSGPLLKALEKPKPPALAGKQEEKKPEPKPADGSDKKPLSAVLLTASSAQEAALASSLTLSAKGNPAPGTSTFDFEADEVKIPAWLEPLARNSSPALTHETKLSSQTESRVPLVPDAQPLDASFSLLATEPAVSSAEEHPVSLIPPGSASSSDEPSAADADPQPAVFTLSGEGPTPNFGSSLPIDTDAKAQDSPKKSSGGGLKFMLLAASVLLAAGGGWFWYSNQYGNPFSGTAAAANGAAQIETNPAPAPPESPRVISPGVNSAEKTIRPASGSLAPKTDNEPLTDSALGPSKSAWNNPQIVVTPSEPNKSLPKKPSLGDVHLAAPKVNQRASTSSDTDSAPALNANAPNGDGANLNLFSGKGPQPVMPVPIGGDVKPAQLLSSVPPVYPALARTQHVSGGVKVDALIDTHGNVAAMKVISGPALLHQAAMDALRQWKYRAAMLNGQPTAMHLTVTVDFKLQ